MASQTPLSREEQFWFLMDRHWLVRYLPAGAIVWQVALYVTEKEATIAMETLTTAGGLCFLYNLRAAYTPKTDVTKHRLN